eukprot:2054453-Rhodomonas_salina.2
MLIFYYQGLALGASRVSRYDHPDTAKSNPNSHVPCANYTGNAVSRLWKMQSVLHDPSTTPLACNPPLSVARSIRPHVLFCGLSFRILCATSTRLTCVRRAGAREWSERCEHRAWENRLGAELA